MNNLPQTRKDIIAQIERFCEQYPKAPYSFAHIVLGDFNLGDGHIRYCLDQSKIDQWMKQKTEEATNWQGDNEFGLRYALDQLEQTRVETVRFLNWLQTIPESIREGGS